MHDTSTGTYYEQIKYPKCEQVCMHMSGNGHALAVLDHALITSPKELDAFVLAN